MATNPDPNYLNQQPRRVEDERRMQDPELQPVQRGGGISWGLVGIIITILCLAGIIWYFH